MKFRLQQIAEMLEGRLLGDAEIEVSKLIKIDENDKSGLTFLFSPAYLHHLELTNASAIVISEHLLPKEKTNKNLIVVADAYASFVRLLGIYDELLKSNRKIEINKNSEIHESVKINKNVSVGAFVVIEENVVLSESVHIYPNVFIGKNSTIGKGTIIHPGVVLYSDSIIGENCVIHSGVVIGSDGFGFAPNEKGEFKKIPQLGNVIIEDEVEIGANSTIDRATLGSTIIRKGVKLDNQIQIAHNVEINKNTVIASQSGIAGSTKIGENVIIGGQVGIAGHLSIPNGVKIQAKSGVNSSPKKGVTQLYGSPAFEATEYRKAYIYFKKFPQLAKKIEELEKAMSK
jgi:UDP-3-O-[3-hydroxymyristoyl] glucosamine N-acyltransferase